MIQAFDTPDPAGTVAKIALLKSQGVQKIIFYISPIWLAGAKTARLAQIKAVLAAGIDVLFVCEGWGGSNNFAHGDINAPDGTRDATVCAHYLDQLGAPDGVAIYPTVDNDVNQAQFNSLCLPYFMAFRKALPAKYKLGAYGCGFLLAGLDAAKLIDFRWLSNAMGWNGSKAYLASGKADIVQGRETKLDGLDIDPDQINPANGDVGAWKAGPSIMNINSDVAH